jgi:excisionase family DNA binding protein
MTTKPNSPTVPLLTIKEVAAILHCCTKTVRRLIAKKELAVVKLGRWIRVRQDDLDRFILRHRFG